MQPQYDVALLKPPSPNELNGTLKFVATTLIGDPEPCDEEAPAAAPAGEEAPAPKAGKAKARTDVLELRTPGLLLTSPNLA